MPEPTVLSGSSLNTWLECPKEWEYAYLWRLERPPSYKMAIGTAAHYAVEVGMKARLETGEYPPIDTWLDAFHASWKIETKDAKPRNDKPEESESEHWHSGMTCVRFYAETIAPTIVPLAVELPIRFTINGHTWTGTADLIEDRTVYEPGHTGFLHYAVRDHKFTSKRPDNPARYRWPMIGYAIGLRRHFAAQLGENTEDDVILDYVIRNKKPIHFPVATGGPVTDADILDLAQEVENAMAAINRGSFPATGPQTGACNWCPFWDICPSYIGRKKKE